MIINFNPRQNDKRKIYITGGEGNFLNQFGMKKQLLILYNVGCNLFR